MDVRYFEAEFIFILLMLCIFALYIMMCTWCIVVLRCWCVGRSFGQTLTVVILTSIGLISLKYCSGIAIALIFFLNRNNDKKKRFLTGV